MKKWTKYLSIITVMFFALGFVNIIFAYLGLACLILPFVFLAKDKKKTWCQYYCPRANLFTVLFRRRSLIGKPGPDWLVKGKGKWILLTYFSINIFIITMSTVMVLNGKREPLEQVRFLLAFPIPWSLPQLIDIGPIADWKLHLSYRIYSMMFTATTLGLILGVLFLPRTWCTVCPVNTLSDISLKKMKKEKVLSARIEG